MRRLRSLLQFIYASLVRPIGRAVGALLGLVPALLAGAGVFLVVAGLFYYLQPASADLADATPTPSIQSAAPYSLPPLASLSPSAGTSVSAAIATRVTIPALSIDLPVVAPPPNEEFPLCNAAEYAVLDKPMAFPGLPQATYIYAHARTAGMFLPLLTQARINNGASMIGMWVEVYTADNQRHVYQITQVIRHVPDSSSAFDGAIAATTDQLWLQTSEGTIHDPYKMQVVADPVGVLAASPADAHPTGRGNVCPDAPKCKAANGGGCKR
jgi:Sortase domain